MRINTRNKLRINFIKYTLLFVMFFVFSCSKNPKCWGGNKNKGIIVKSFSIIGSLSCQPISNQKNFIITTDSLYKKTFPVGCKLDTIDFNTYSLLGQYGSGSCNIKFIREVKQKDEVYHYKLKVKSCRACKSYGFSYNWVLVPKIPQGWTVKFEKEEN